jgi:glycosyltransferase involved in cell wall biosynthesis
MTDRRRDPSVGLVSPLPPQVGGVAAAAQWLLDHEHEIECRYEVFDLKRPAAAQAGGRLSFRAVLRQVRISLAFVRWLPGSPRLLHYMVAYTPTGVTRDATLFLLARLFGRRAIAHVQLPSGDLIDEPTSSIRLAALRAVAQLAERTITISPRAAAALEERGIAADWVFNPVSLEPAAEPAGPSRPRTFLDVLFVGTYGRRKGCDVLVEALASVRARGIDARLRIVGKEEYDGEDESLPSESRQPSIFSASPAPTV